MRTRAPTWRSSRFREAGPNVGDQTPQGGGVFLDPEDGLAVAVVTRDVASTEDISGQLAEATIQAVSFSIFMSP